MDMANKGARLASVEFEALSALSVAAVSGGAIEALSPEVDLKKLFKLAKNNYQFQDQDIMNIACAGKKTIIPWHYNMTTYSFYYLECEPDKIVGKYANSDIERARNHSNIHFNGAKPWKSYSINFDVWWEYYRKSPVFKSEYYFDFFYKKLTEYDQLTLWKRIKILARYFIHGRQK